MCRSVLVPMMKLLLFYHVIQTYTDYICTKTAVHLPSGFQGHRGDSGLHYIIKYIQHIISHVVYSYNMLEQYIYIYIYWGRDGKGIIIKKTYNHQHIQYS